MRGDVFNQDETACTLTDPKAYEAVQFFADMVVKDKTAPTSSTLQTMQGSVNMFSTDQVAMYWGNAWDIESLDAAREQGLDWGGCMAPKANDGNRCFYEHTSCWGIWTGTKVADLAWDYCRDFVSDADLRNDLNTTEWVVPVVKSLLHTCLTPKADAMGWTGVVDILGDPRKIRYPGAGDKWDKIAGMIQAELDLVFVGDKTAQEAAATACPQVDEELARA